MLYSNQAYISFAEGLTRWPRRRYVDPIRLAHPFRGPELLPTAPLTSAEAWVNRQLATLSGSARLYTRLALAEVVIEQIERGYTSVTADWCDASEALRLLAWRLVRSAREFTAGQVSAAQLFGDAECCEWAEHARRCEHSAGTVFLAIRTMLEPQFLARVFDLWMLMGRYWFETEPPRRDDPRDLQRTGWTRSMRQEAAILRPWWHRWQCRLAIASPREFQFADVSWRDALEASIGRRARFDGMLDFIDWQADEVTDEMLESTRWQVREQTLICALRKDVDTWCSRVQQLVAHDRSQRVREAAGEWLHRHKSHRAAKAILKKYRSRAASTG